MDESIRKFSRDSDYGKRCSWECVCINWPELTLSSVIVHCIRCFTITRGPQSRQMSSLISDVARVCRTVLGPLYLYTRGFMASPNTMTDQGPGVQSQRPSTGATVASQTLTPIPHSHTANMRKSTLLTNC